MRYHFGIKRDEKRGAIPVQAYRLNGVTFHYRTAAFDRQAGEHLHKAGQVAEFDDATHEGIKKALKLERAPKDLDRSLRDKIVETKNAKGELVREVARDASGAIVQEFKDPRAEHFRAPEKATGLGSSFKVLDWRDVAGFGKVVQWSAVRDDDGNKIVGWISKVLDLSDRDYQPTENPDDEVPLHRYIYCEPRAASEFNPPSIELDDEEARNAAGIEREEEQRDPVGFEKTKTAQERAKRAKAAGLEVHTPSA